MVFFEFKSVIVRCTEQLNVRLGTEILRTRQRKATWHECSKHCIIYIQIDLCTLVPLFAMI